VAIFDSAGVGVDGLIKLTYLLVEPLEREIAAEIRRRVPGDAAPASDGGFPPLVPPQRTAAYRASRSKADGRLSTNSRRSRADRIERPLAPDCVEKVGLAVVSAV
jgi:hypothetical protein